jgi:alkylation response protein AidB-like acyl-CoA dehydrogenase
MDFTENDDLRQVRRAVAELAARFDSDYWGAARPRAHLPMGVLQGVRRRRVDGRHGVGGVRRGGLGIAAAGVMVETLVRSGGAMNACTPLHLNMFGMNVVAKHGSDEMRRRTLTRVATGELHACFGVTEPDAGTDTSRISNTARRGQVAAGLLDAMPAGATEDLLSAYALPLPIAVISDMLGVPEEARGRFRDWTLSFVRSRRRGCEPRTRGS